MFHLGILEYIDIHIILGYKMIRYKILKSNGYILKSKGF
jgi:hypothetical protein